MKKSHQAVMAALLVMFGVLLIIASFVTPPTGVIDPTVLAAFGEILTFAGSIIGLDYHYKLKATGNLGN